MDLEHTGFVMGEDFIEWVRTLEVFIEWVRTLSSNSGALLLRLTEFPSTPIWTLLINRTYMAFTTGRAKHALGMQGETGRHRD